MQKIEIENVIKVVERLRDPVHGCPWDLKQSHFSLLKYLLEESYEFIEAVELNDPQKMQEEIGDVLLQVLLHCQIASESKMFDLESVAKTLAEKLVRRHPHVFEKDAPPIDAETVVLNWQKIKEEEKEKDRERSDYGRAIKKSLLHAPALTSSLNIGKKTQEIKFDWDNYQQVAYKVEEEWQELKEEIMASKLNQDRIEEEMGDLLFSMAQLSRHLNVDPEIALKKANQKFMRRFYQTEDLINRSGKKIEQMNQHEMDEYWNQAKQMEKKLP